jgi:preprotein translocase SecF subunit
VSEDEVRRNIARELQSLPKYDLSRVREIQEILLPEPFEPAEDSLFVNLASPFSAEALEAELKKHGFQTLEVTGLEGAGGQFTRFQLRVDEGRYGELRSILRDVSGLKLSEPFPRYTKIGKAVAGDMVWQAVVALVLSWVALLVYVGLRFHGVKYGAAAIIALVHDALVTVVALSVFDSLGLVDGKINLTMIAALLTIVGYSVNDTIVIFDRVRENVQNMGKQASYADLVNLSNNQMLARTILTSGVTLLSVVALFIFGGSVIHGFAFAMLVGMISGCYSTVFIACPILAEWDRIFGETSPSRANSGQ